LPAWAAGAAVQVVDLDAAALAGDLALVVQATIVLPTLAPAADLAAAARVADLAEAAPEVDLGAAAPGADLAAAAPAAIVLPTLAPAADLAVAALVVDLDAAVRATMILPTLALAADLEEVVPVAARAGRTAAQGRQMRRAQLPVIPLPTVHREAVSPAWAEATMRSLRRWPN